jgi:hypothetical protein
VAERVRGIGATLSAVLREAEATGTTPFAAARKHVEKALAGAPGRRARERLAEGDRRRPVPAGELC